MYSSISRLSARVASRAAVAGLSSLEKRWRFVKDPTEKESSKGPSLESLEEIEPVLASSRRDKASWSKERLDAMEQSSEHCMDLFKPDFIFLS
jgi:hypothetical protein